MGNGILPGNGSLIGNHVTKKPPQFLRGRANRQSFYSGLSCQIETRPEVRERNAHGIGQLEQGAGRDFRTVAEIVNCGGTDTGRVYGCGGCVAIAAKR